MGGETCSRFGCSNPHWTVKVPVWPRALPIVSGCSGRGGRGRRAATAGARTASSRPFLPPSSPPRDASRGGRRDKWKARGTNGVRLVATGPPLSARSAMGIRYSQPPAEPRMDQLWSWLVGFVHPVISPVSSFTLKNSLAFRISL